MIRRIAAVLAATAMLLVLAVPVMAGGWADIVADGQISPTPTEGKPVEIGFKVLQHGVTPAPWEGATVRFTDSGTGESFDVVAKNDRPDGHFIATATMPNAGYWSWQVTLQDLESQHVPVRMTVLSANGQVPAFDPSTMLAAVDKAKIDVTNSLREQLGTEVQRLDTQDDYYRARIDNLVAQTKDLTATRDALAARVDALEGVGGLPLVAVIGLSVLAGSAAGFAVAWLAGRAPRRRGPAVTLAPAPRGADPV